MGFWIFMLLVDLMIPLTMIGFGSVFHRNAPDQINVLFGYRTAMSMKNRQTWEFAHRHFGRLWYRGGQVLLVISVPVLLTVLGKGKDPVGMVGAAVCYVQLAVMLLSLIPTEMALRKHFDKDGNPKPPLEG